LFSALVCRGPLIKTPYVTGRDTVLVEIPLSPVSYQLNLENESAGSEKEEGVQKGL
jgi:hypothetical protein